jgi:hypothetical protein
MGLRPQEFYAISPRDFELMAQGFKNGRVDQYRQTRNIMFTMAKLWGSKINTPAELWELPGDRDVLEGKSDDELKKLFEWLKDSK